jgi:lipopolysaccharide/colanic/teichoic acid biosynthesis glycosyltransferase
MRRVLDVLFALFWLTLACPIMAIIAVFIKRDSPGPIFYIPTVVGRHGRPFPLFRFRTMHIDRDPADQIRCPFTQVGQFIRNYSLDHLPMLFNLLIGDVTLIGPRPMEVGRVDLHDPSWQAYCSVKPGLLSYAVLALGKRWTPLQHSTPQHNQQLELAYLKQRSWWTDLRLFMRSLAALISSGGNVKARKEPDRGVEL